METVDFYPKTFNNIPRQDNPAFGDKKCIMIVKDHNKVDHAVVLSIDPEDAPLGDTVTHIAVFWRHKLALEYAKFVCGDKT